MCQQFNHAEVETIVVDAVCDWVVCCAVVGGVELLLVAVSAGATVTVLVVLAALLVCLGEVALTVEEALAVLGMPFVVDIKEVLLELEPRDTVPLSEL